MKTIICLFLLGVSFQGFAQSSINSSGMYASGGSGNVASAIGQVFYEPFGSPSGSVHPGVEQPYEILETLGMDVKEIGLNLKIYPNPTPDILYLNIDFKDFRKYSFELLDNSGRSLMIKPVDSSTVSFSMGSYAAGVYLLKVTKNGKLIKIFKVIKSDK